METEGDLGDWRDCGDQWICTQVKKKVQEMAGDRGKPRRLERLWRSVDMHTGKKKGMRDSWRLRATWETGEAVLRTVDIHTSEEKGTRDSWRLRETKETGETVETNGHGH